ncbi:MAG: hypothetical protein A4E31_01352 [Methanomassiliicoccales archaeon PtaU1.Bin030]|nr:MAG: hypothetical protein A4E31_01352 [Methanomassiliicoccales archaeon PtaU1.Bin030]
MNFRGRSSFFMVGIISIVVGFAIGFIGYTIGNNAFTTGELYWANIIGSVAAGFIVLGGASLMISLLRSDNS